MTLYQTEYEQEINALIPSAETEATLKALALNKNKETRPGKGGETYNYCFWTEFFHAAMNRIANEKGLRPL